METFSVADRGFSRVAKSPTLLGDTSPTFYQISENLHETKKTIGPWETRRSANHFGQCLGIKVVIASKYKYRVDYEEFETNA